MRSSNAVLRSRGVAPKMRRKLRQNRRVVMSAYGSWPEARRAALRSLSTRFSGHRSRKVFLRKRTLESFKCGVFLLYFGVAESAPKMRRKLRFLRRVVMSDVLLPHYSVSRFTIFIFSSCYSNLNSNLPLQH